ncbi:MAG: efflux RND transporter periplasmic adaptor subunit [Acidobacteria bacterium]|nr:efflux RND transporter periplasmic adaptor subunit [Acidobacteriota bacterium]
MDSPASAKAPNLAALRIEEKVRARRSGRWGWFAAVFGGIVIVAALMLAAKSRPALVQVSAVRGGAASERVALLNASGYVTPRRRATIAAKITARVTEMDAEEGMRAREGQILARLDDSDYQVRLASAKADREATSAALQDLEVQLANAERELRRTQELERNRVASTQSLDLARTTADSLKAKISLTQEQVQAAAAKVVVAQQDVDNCIVRAPFDGMVVSKDAQVGEMVSPISAGGGFTRTGIATLVDMKSIEVEVDVNEAYIARVQPGMPVTSILDAYPDWQIPSKVRTIIPTADRQKATVKVRISFDRLDPRILPDMGVKVTFLGDQLAQSGAGVESKKGTRILFVPKEAIHDDAGRQVVFLYREGKVERRAVKLGAAEGGDQQVIAGLNEGDQVVVSGFEGLKDGQHVELRR